jgi:hypothetical protein
LSSSVCCMYVGVISTLKIYLKHFSVAVVYIC